MLPYIVYCYTGPVALYSLLLYWCRALVLFLYRLYVCIHVVIHCLVLSSDKVLTHIYMDARIDKYTDGWMGILIHQQIHTYKYIHI